MAPTDPTWDNTGFEPDPNENEGFAGPRPVQPEPAQKIPTPPKRRSSLFWFAVASSMVLLVALIGGGIYWLSQPTPEERAFYASADNAPSVVVPPSHDSDVQAPSHISVDTFPNQSLSDRADLEPSASDTSEQIKKKPATTLMRKEKKSEIIEEQSAPPTAPSRVEAPKQTEPMPSAAKRPAMTTTPSASANPLYVIQVFSSPSRDDADEWLQSLLEKNVSNGYITEQKIKGQPWYRVRFGQFSTRESAESEAIRLGFREPWIARIR